jgi:hypothetical protein
MEQESCSQNPTLIHILSQINSFYIITHQITNSMAPEPKGLSPYSQEPAPGTYSEPTESTLPPSQFFQDPFWSHPPIYTSVFRVVSFLLILDLGTRWGWVVSVTPRPRFTPGTHCTGGWVSSRAGLDTEARGKILCPCRESNLDRPVVQSVARHYTDWANPAPIS